MQYSAFIKLVKQFNSINKTIQNENIRKMNRGRHWSTLAFNCLCKHWNIVLFVFVHEKGGFIHRPTGSLGGSIIEWATIRHGGSNYSVAYWECWRVKHFSFECFVYMGTCRRRSDTILSILLKILNFFGHPKF